MLGRTDRRGRLVVVLAAFLLLASAACARLAYWQVAARADLVAMARQQLDRPDVQAATRGSIYDRTGTVLLATTAYRDRLVAYPDQIAADQRGPIGDRLVQILGLGAADAAALRAQLASSSGYAVLAEELSPGQSQAVQDGLDGGSLTELGLEPHPVRVYPNPGGAPNTTLASQLLGFVNSQGQGQYGIEQRYQQLLAGRDRVVVAERDIAGRPIAGSETVTDPGAPGSDLRLTIDAGLQLAVERELSAASVADGAARASAIVMDAATGEVVAWATAPGYDANGYGAIAAKNPASFVDPIASSVYEPGSVMKMFTVTAALEKKVVTPTTRINDSGVMQIGPNQIADADRRAMGSITVQDVIAYSRNVGAARIAQLLGKSTQGASEALYALWAKLGIGSLTGVDVAGEVGGIVTDPASTPWAPIDLANHSFGQGVAVTLAQLARGYAAMVNGGYLVTPHVVESVAGRSVPTGTPQRVLSASLSSTLVKMMRHTVTTVPWYAQGTLIPGYDVGGKTGTAQIWDAKHGEWLPYVYNFTFVGYLGRQHPEYVIAIDIDHGQPTILGQGIFQQSITSYELFRRIGRDAIQTLDLAPLPARTASPSPSSSTAPSDGIEPQPAGEVPGASPRRSQAP